MKVKKRCEYVIVTEQKARVTYDNLLRLIDDPDVCDPIKYLREREIVHYQRFGDANLPHSNRFLNLQTTNDIKNAKDRTNEIADP